MRISKERAENIATAITKPMRDNIEAARKSLNEKGKEIIQAAVPKEIMTLFKKHPNHFKTNSSVRFTGVGIVRDIPVVLVARSLSISMNFSYRIPMQKKL
jgi:hypothetical protein